MMKDLSSLLEERQAGQHSAGHERQRDERPHHAPALSWAAPALCPSSDRLTCAPISRRGQQARLRAAHPHNSANLLASDSFTFRSTRSSKISNTAYRPHMTLWPVHACRHACRSYM